jgi:type I restriction enzyme S subunit
VTRGVDGVTWPTAPLGRIVRIVGGGTPSKARSDFWDGTIPWVSPKDMGARELHDASDHISQAAVDGSATQVVPAGSVLIVVRSGILIHRFPVSLARTQVALNQDLKALLPGGPLLPDYLAYALNAKSNHVLRECVKRGATVHSVDIGKLQQVSLAVPPPSEQRRIVEILDQADRLRRLRAEADATADRILPALFIKMFGDPWINPRSWSIDRLRRIAEVQGGLQLTPKRAENPLDVPYLRVANVHRGRLDLSEIKRLPVTEQELRRTRLRPGDILVVEGHGNPKEIGRSAIWDGSVDPCVHQNHLIRVRVTPDRATPEFVSAFLNSASGRQHLLRAGKTTSGLNTISVTNVQRVEILAPPLGLQREFSSRVMNHAQNHGNRQLAASALERLWALVVGRAFSGNLTAAWRTAHMKELLREMEHQAKTMGGVP